MIKKIVYFILIVVVLLITTIFAIIQYTQYKAGKSLIAADAQWVVQFDGWQYFQSNWRSMLDFEYDSVEGKWFSIFDIPLYVYLFNSDASPNYVHICLPLEQNRNASEVLAKNGWQLVAENTWSKAALTIQLKKDYGILSWAMQIQENDAHTPELNQLVAIDNSTFNNLRKAGGMISIQHLQNIFLEMHFNKGAIQLVGEIKDMGNLPLQQYNIPSNTIVYANLPISLYQIPFLHPTFSKEDNNDKLYNLFDSTAYPTLLMLDSFFVVKDSIVTYEYDEDFNKITKHTTQDVTVPYIALALNKCKQNSDTLKDGQAIRRSLLPIYPFYYYHLNDGNAVMTTAQNPFQSLGQKDHHAGSLIVNIHKLNQRFSIAQHFKVIDNLKLLQLDIVPAASGYSINGHILLQHNNQESSELIKAFFN